MNDIQRGAIEFFHLQRLPNHFPRILEELLFVLDHLGRALLAELNKHGPRGSVALLILGFIWGTLDSGSFVIVGNSLFALP